MRHFARALSSAVIVACCSPSITAAESTGSSWWPWGHSDAKPAAPTGLGASMPLGDPKTDIANTAKPLTGEPSSTSGSGAAAGSASKDHWMVNSDKGKVSWPKLTMPHLPSTTASADEKKKAAEAAKKNSWVEKTPTPPKPSPLKPVTDGANKVAKSTKEAWHKTVNAVTPGSSTPTRSNSGSSGGQVAKKEMDSPWYKRMFGIKPEVQQPQTVPQWMAQQRLDP